MQEGCPTNLKRRTNERLDRQLFHAVEGGDVKEASRLLSEGATPTWKDSFGHTALHTAIGHSEANIACLKLLLKERADLNEQNNDGDTILHRACSKGYLDCVKAIVSSTGVCGLLGVFNKQGRNALGEAVHSEMLNIITYFLDEHNVDLKSSVTETGDNLLGLAVREGKIDVIKYLITEKNVDIRDPGTQTGSTSLEIAVLAKKTDVIKCLVSDLKLPVANDILFWACKFCRNHIVEFLLTELNCNPNITNAEGKTPLSLAATKKKIVQLLLQHEAVSDNVYTEHRRSLGNVFSKEPLKSPVKMFVIGDGSEGKSTLIEAMEQEHNPIASFFKPAKEVTGVSQQTIGIAPHVFRSRFYGDVLFLDVAGQEAFYSSHASIIKSAVSTSPPIFILVVGLHREDSTTARSIRYWLGIIADQCCDIVGKVPLVVVGSHADLVTEIREQERKQRVISQAVKTLPMFDLAESIPMDCRYPNSDGMKTLRRKIGMLCTSIQTKLSVSLNAHMFLNYLLEKFSEKIAVMLSKAQKQIKLDSQWQFHQELSKRDKEALPYIPMTIYRLVEICIQLSDKGHILFLHNTAFPEKSYIILDQKALLSEVSGTIFSPNNFKEHCQLSTSTGVVPKSKLAEHFAKYKPELISGFLCQLELAIPVDDNEILGLICQPEEMNESLAGTTESYIFCPGLIRLNAPIRVWSYQADCEYVFGWNLSCVKENQFLNYRFFHALLLRLALSLRASIKLDDSIPSLQRFCSIWNKGIQWCTSNETKVLIQLSDNFQSLSLRICACKLTLKCLKLRSHLINKIREAAQDFCSSVETVESLVAPSDFMSSSLKSSSESQQNIYHLKHVAESIINCETGVESLYKPVSLTHLLKIEVYTNLGENIIQLLFNKDLLEHKEKVSNRFIAALGKAWSESPHLLVDTILLALRDEIDPQHDYSDLEKVLKTWRDHTDGTYGALRVVLDPLSVLAGHNPLELAGVSLKPFLEDSLPASQVSIIQDPSILNTVIEIDQLRALTNSLWDIRPEWYLFGTQLGIDTATLRVIKSDSRDSIDASFVSMLEYFLRRVHPPPTWVDLVQALQSDPVNKPDLVSRIEMMAKNVCLFQRIPHEAGKQQSSTEPLVILTEDSHLQAVKELTWVARAQWKFLGGALGVLPGTIDAIQSENTENGEMLTNVLKAWMYGGAATIHMLLKALSNHTVHCGDVCRHIQSLRGEARKNLGLCEDNCTLCCLSSNSLA